MRTWIWIFIVGYTVAALMLAVHLASTVGRKRWLWVTLAVYAVGVFFFVYYGLSR